MDQVNERMAPKGKGLRLSMWLLIIAAAMIGLVILLYIGIFVSIWMIPTQLDG
jgi:hypothetical protein